MEGLVGGEGLDFVFVEFLWKGVFGLRVIFLLWLEVLFGSDGDFECIITSFVLKLLDPEGNVQEGLFSQDI